MSKQLAVAFEPLIKDAIYDARNKGTTIDVAAQDAASKVAWKITELLRDPALVDVFKAAWHDADERGLAGSRVVHGLTAVTAQVIG